MAIKAGVAGVGAIGGGVWKALIQKDIPDMKLAAVADVRKDIPFPVPNLDFAALAEEAEVIVEALPPDIVPSLARAALARGRTLVMISGAALLRFPEIRQWAADSRGRII